MYVESQCCLNIYYSAKCFLEVNNGVGSNNRIRKFIPVAYNSIAEMILCNMTVLISPGEPDRGLEYSREWQPTLDDTQC